MEEGGGGGGHENKGIEPEAERWKGKFETSFFLVISLSLVSHSLCFIHQRQGESRAGISAAVALIHDHPVFNPRRLLPGSGVGGGQF